jgi:hypothetical protein
MRAVIVKCRHPGMYHKSKRPLWYTNKNLWLVGEEVIDNCSVVDPYMFRICIFCQCKSGYRTGSRSRVLMTKTGKNLQLFFDQKWQFTYPKASIKAVKLQKKSSWLKREHLALKNLNFGSTTLYKKGVIIAQAGSQIKPKSR